MVFSKMLIVDKVTPSSSNEAAVESWKKFSIDLFISALRP